MTTFEYDALPSRGDCRDYVIGTVYRDPENPTTVFLYEGKDSWREGFASGRPGIERNDIWLAREATIIDGAAVALNTATR